MDRADEELIEDLYRYWHLAWGHWYNCPRRAHIASLPPDHGAHQLPKDSHCPVVREWLAQAKN